MFTRLQASGTHQLPGCPLVQFGPLPCHFLFANLDLLLQSCRRLAQHSLGLGHLLLPFADFLGAFAYLLLQCPQGLFGPGQGGLAFLRTAC